MELWIRTQDKRQLLKVNDGLYIANGFSDTHDTFIGIKNVGHIGRYEKVERALEVLDNIETIILLQSMYKYDNKELIQAWENLSEDEIKKLRKQICVYEMPEE